MTVFVTVVSMVEMHTSQKFPMFERFFEKPSLVPDELSFIVPLESALIIDKGGIVKLANIGNGYCPLSILCGTRIINCEVASPKDRMVKLGGKKFISI
jgi:hypothetical protein